MFCQVNIVLKVCFRSYTRGCVFACTYPSSCEDAGCHAGSDLIVDGGCTRATMPRLTSWRCMMECTADLRNMRYRVQRVREWGGYDVS